MEKECKCTKILIVIKDNKIDLETIICNLGFTVDCCDNGKSALELIITRQKNTCGPNCQCYIAIFIDMKTPEEENLASEIQKIKK